MPAPRSSVLVPLAASRGAARYEGLWTLCELPVVVVDGRKPANSRQRERQRRDSSALPKFKKPRLLTAARRRRARDRSIDRARWTAARITTRPRSLSRQAPARQPHAAMDEQRALLDQLMGSQRDIPDHKKREVHFYDREIDKFWLLGVQPFDLFRNTSWSPRLASIYRGSMGYDLERSMGCLLYTSPSPRDYAASRMPSSA